MRRPNFCVLVFAAATGLFTSSVFAQNLTDQGQAPAINLALVAAPSSSFVSGDTTVSALNDGFTPNSSADAHHGSYGNWNRTGTQWVQYDWPQSISTRQV